MSIDEIIDILKKAANNAHALVRESEFADIMLAIAGLEKIAEEIKQQSAEIDIMRGVLHRCAEIFRSYAAIHAAKSDNIKSDLNTGRALMCEHALNAEGRE